MEIERNGERRGEKERGARGRYNIEGEIESEREGEIE